ncbi:unnamed protein product [Dracunculus medinensis]|uniref:carbonyl reductase (NADPH) n=1 Tax=Dracunculus medinensis TaxID=318479 RepID=A0A0N4U2V1_DRAME|nr:unnamed protein product [Dracunculus medinensis]
MSADRIFVVTGANKGIGYAIVKGLAQQLSNGVIYLTSRNEKLGKESFAKIVSELDDKKKHKIRYHQLDITDRKSIDNFAVYLKKEHDGFDVLINNAAFAFNHNASEPAELKARITIGTNYYGTKQVCDILFPLIRSGGRVVNVCSQMGVLDHRYSDEVIRRFTDPNLTTADIDNIIKDYEQACIHNNRREKGFPESAYSISKAVMIALTFIQAKELAARNIIVNACCPGYVKTDMTSHKGTLTIEEGAVTPIYLATLQENEPNGEFIYLCKPINWVSKRPQ